MNTMSFQDILRVVVHWAIRECVRSFDEELPQIFHAVNVNKVTSKSRNPKHIAVFCSHLPDAFYHIQAHFSQR